MDHLSGYTWAEAFTALTSVIAFLLLSVLIMLTLTLMMQLLSVTRVTFISGRPQILTLVSIIILFIAPVVFAALFPTAYNTDYGEYHYSILDGHGNPWDSFAGYESDDELSTIWGGDLGWYLSWIAAVFMILSYHNQRMAHKELNKNRAPGPTNSDEE